MDQVFDTLHNWRFPCGVVFVAPFIGRFIYRMIPAPDDAVDHLAAMERAARAQVAAGRVGISQLERVAGAFGMAAGAELMETLRKQRRKCLIGSYIVVLLLMIPVFIFLPVAVFPDWAYGALAAVGAYFTWKMW